MIIFATLAGVVIGATVTLAYLVGIETGKSGRRD